MADKKNVPLIIALSIPVLMVVLVAVSIYLPSAFVKPQTDFIYAVEGDYYCRTHTFSVQMGRVTQVEVKQQNQSQYNCGDLRKPRVFYYDVKTDQSKEITGEQAAQFVVDDTPRSVDGFEVVSGGGGSDIFSFGGYDYYNRYLKKGSYARRINAVVGQQYYYNGFRFLGWVKGAN